VALVGCGRLSFDPRDDARDAAPGLDSGPARACPAGPLTCGAESTTCCESLVVPGGTFLRGFDRASDGLYSDASFPASVSAFRLDTFEVTVGRFRPFVEANGGTQAAPPTPNAGVQANGLGGWDPSWNQYLPAARAQLETALACSTSASWTTTPGANEKLAISCVSWFEAAAFCAWDGGFLPSEAQWNFAASGGDEQRVYPWSQPPESPTLDATLAIYNCLGDGVPGCDAAEMLIEVGSRPLGRGRWGQLDLAGSQWEWSFDADQPFMNPCNDCERAPLSGSSVVRGGYWANSSDNLRNGHRGSESAISGPRWMGVRCARPL